MAKVVPPSIIQLEIDLLDSRRGAKQKKTVLRRILGNATLNHPETASFLPHIFHFYQYGDYETKSMCCTFFTTYSYYNPPRYFENRAIFEHDLAGSDEHTKCLILRTLAYIPDETLQKKVVMPFSLRFLGDPSKNARKSACFTIARLFDTYPDHSMDLGLLDKLRSKIHDSDPEVVGACVASLDHILERSSGIHMDLDYKTTDKLLEVLKGASEFFQAYILNLVTLFVPQSSLDAANLIEKTFPYLSHTNSSVVLNALKVIVYLCNYVKAPQDRFLGLPKRLGTALMLLLSKPLEIQFVVLRNVILLLLAQPGLFRLDVSMFFCHHSDLVSVKDTKLEIIYLLANEDNFATVLRELEHYSRGSDPLLARKALRAIGNLAVKLETAAKNCLDSILELATSGLGYVIQECVCVVRNIFRRYPEYASPSNVKIFTSQADLVEEPEAKTAFLWLVGQYGELVPDSADILKDFSYTLAQETVEVQLATITAIAKFYLKNPVQRRKLLLETLTMASEQSRNPDVVDRAFYYWRLVSFDMEAAQDIILAPQPIISQAPDRLEPEVLEELELVIGLLALIYLKPIQSVFRLAKARMLPELPALQKSYNSRLKEHAVTSEESKVLKIDVRAHIGVILPKLHETSSFQAKIKAKSPSLRSNLFVRNHILAGLKQGYSPESSFEEKLVVSETHYSGLTDSAIQVRTPNLGSKLRNRVRNSLILGPSRNFSL